MSRAPVTAAGSFGLAGVLLLATLLAVAIGLPLIGAHP